MNNLQTVPRRAARSILDVDDLESGEIASLLADAARARTDRSAWTTALAGRHVALVFDKPSTRTRVSFEVGIASMGATPLVLKGDELQLGRGESLDDTARALSCYVDAIVIRMSDHDALAQFARGSRVPVVNALTTAAHPCQTLADLLTIADTFGDFEGVRVAYVGDPNNVAHSLMLGCALTGMTFSIASPESHPPSEEVVARAQKIAAPPLWKLDVTTNPVVAVNEAHVVYTDTWTSMGFEAEERERRKTFAPYRVTGELLSHARSDAIVMHCLPAHRGDEITSEVLDGPHSAVWQQAENRLCAQMALLRLLCSGA